MTIKLTEIEIKQQNYYTKLILIKYILYNESDMALPNPSVCLSVHQSVYMFLYRNSSVSTQSGSSRLRSLVSRRPVVENCSSDVTEVVGIAR